MSDAFDDRPPRKGRGFPPKVHQYRPGESGNPSGRPPGAKKKLKDKAQALGLTPSDVIAIEEGHRIVKSVDGKRLPTISAIHRARNIGAMKGNRFMAKDADVRLTRAEEKIARAKREQFEKAFELQNLSERMISHLRATGVTDPDVYPHPDDFLFDHATMEVRIEGPMSASEKRQWDDILKELATVRRRVLYYRKRIENEPSDGLHYMLMRMTYGFMTINSMFPERYRLERLPIWKVGKSIALPEKWLAAISDASVRGRRR